MERQIDLEQVTDGKKYTVNDMAKLGCNDCMGCSACCHGMGDSILLDPYDIYRMTTGLNCKFEELLVSKIDLNVVDGMILPNLKMTEGSGQCGFLNEEGRCSIHSIRPGICRIFPLGRVYENGTFYYVLQIHECERARTKIKIKKWIDTPELAKNEAFINRWHSFIKAWGARMPQLSKERVKQINLYVLNVFFVTLYEGNRDFYEQFEERMKAAEAFLA